MKLTRFNESFIGTTDGRFSDLFMVPSRFSKGKFEKKNLEFFQAKSMEFFLPIVGC